MDLGTLVPTGTSEASLERLLSVGHLCCSGVCCDAGTSKTLVLFLPYPEPIVVGLVMHVLWFCCCCISCVVGCTLLCLGFPSVALLFSAVLPFPCV
jgi:hypothetical protein